MKYRDIKKVLNANGWKETYVLGAQHQFRKCGVVHSITLPDFQEQPLPTSLLIDLEKKTGLSER